MRSGVAQVKVATAADTETATARCKLVGVTLVSWSVYFLVYIVFFFGFVFAAFGTPFRLLCVFLCLFLQLQQINDDSISGKNMRAYEVYLHLLHDCMKCTDVYT